jgi:hypothetical protein
VSAGVGEALALVDQLLGSAQIADDFRWGMAPEFHGFSLPRLGSFTQCSEVETVYNILVSEGSGQRKIARGKA